MRAIAGFLRATGVCAVVVAALTLSGDARAEGITPVQGDALAQLGTEMLSQGAMVPFGWEQRVALVGMGMAGLYLGTSPGTAGRGETASAVRSAAYRLALPLAGAALGNLVACDRLCDDQQGAADPLVGAMAGALVAHVLDRDTRAARRAAGDASAVQWTPVVSVGLGSYSVGVMGRF